jgi:hypothetical protein
VTDALFETENLASLGPSARTVPEDLSPDRRRTARQRELISRGHHPLAYLGAARHPDTRGLAYERTDRTGRDLTCGSCRCRELMGAGGRTVPKCTGSVSGGWPRATHSAASDVRAWWPACTLFEARDA